MNNKCTTSEREYVKTKSVVICGLARDIEYLIGDLRSKLEFIGGKFAEYRIVVFENDSSDGTRDLLKQWSNDNPKMILLDCCDENNCDCKLNQEHGYKTGMFGTTRITRMATYRNKYLQFVQNTYSDYDYLLVADLDLNGNMSVDGLISSVCKPNWDAIFINGKCPIFGFFGSLTCTYDAFAYIPSSDKDYRFSEKLFLPYLMCRNFIHQELSLLFSNQLVRVKSAFNGYGLYKISSILDASYTGNGKCEHWNLCEHMYNNGFDKLYINPLWYGYFDLQGPGSPISIIQSL
jgi:hypothetical protein